jgi:GT2 family glycosyltransferase
MQLAVIILNWNAAVETISCVRAVNSWERLKPEIWVVDNDSADNSVQAITEACPDVHLICNDANLGYAGGNNRGIAAALERGNSPILLLNNDAHVEETDVIRLVDTLYEHLHIGFIGPPIFAADEPDRLLTAGGKNPVLHHHSHIFQLDPDGMPVRAVDYVPGTVLVGKSEVFQSVGLFDERYFFNTEVADLCTRARQHGYTCAIETRARAFHALDQRPSLFRETLYIYYFVRNRFLYIRKFYRGLRIPLILFWGSYSLALEFKLRLTRDSAKAKAVHLGLVDGWRARFGGRNERVLYEITGQSGPL